MADRDEILEIIKAASSWLSRSPMARRPCACSMRRSPRVCAMRERLEPLSRWARLPAAINGKPKYADEFGAPFQCRLIEWRPDNATRHRRLWIGCNWNLPRPGGRRKPQRPLCRLAVLAEHRQ